MPGALKSYLDQCREANLTLAEVESKLRGAAWPEESVVQAREYYGQPAAPVMPAVPTSNAAVPVSNVGVTNSQMANNSEPIPAVGMMGTNSTVMNSAVGPSSVAGETEKKKNPWLMMALVGLIVVLVLGSGTAVAAYFVATEKIPMANANWKQKISDVVFAVPFIPKTPKYILSSAVVAHSDLARNTFDLSVATTSDDLKTMLGMSQVDFRLKGYTDFTEIKNPKFSVTAEVTREFLAKAVKVDNMIYVKVDKVPALLSSMVGIDPEALRSALVDWIKYDITPLETEARASLEANTTETESGLSKVTHDLLVKMMDEDILPKVKVSTDDVDGFATRKLEYAPDAMELDRIFTKFANEANDVNVTESNLPSKYIKDFSVTVWADQKEGYVRKLSVVFTFDSSDVNRGVSYGSFPVPLSGSKATVAMVLKLADFGVEQEIRVPVGAITPEEFYSRIMNNSMYMRTRTGEDYMAMMKAEVTMVAVALQKYMADNNGKLPVSLNALVPDYLGSVEGFEVDGVVYKTNVAKTYFLVYSTTPDMTSPDKPFVGIDSRFGTIKNYSQSEIDSY